MIDPTSSTPAEVLAAARAIVASRYPDAAFALVAGSLMRGEGTAHSDLDLIVLYDRIESSRRESFVTGGVPVEAFVHDDETLAWAIDVAATRGRPSLLAMIAEATAIGRAPHRAGRLREVVAGLLAKGPPPMAPAQLDALRYAITDAVQDLRGARDEAERVGIGVLLYPLLAELALRGRGRWNATGKWVPRALAGIDDGLARRFDHAFRALFASNAADAVVTLAERELAPHGGMRFDGDVQVAHRSWRASPARFGA
ncbi:MULTISPECIES: nucleotidyltransferase domain-containing protein [unclassified Sphingomonas]|jgi:hypothetical protein|nr:MULTISPECIES: nucleotidyltransferase domain-containing protein [unclassified Sphingomonas]